MNAIAALAKLTSLGLPVIRTTEAAALLGQSPSAASQYLRRLSKAHLIKPLRHGLFWVRSGAIDPWVALDSLAVPYPAYLSLYSALYLRGVLSQVPAVHYAVTLGRAQRIRTEVGDYSLHRVTPELFGGFESLPSGAKLAETEKALFDLAYFAGTRSRLFAKPPELEVPQAIDRQRLRWWLSKIDDQRRRTRVRQQLEWVLHQAGRRL